MPNLKPCRCSGRVHIDTKDYGHRILGVWVTCEKCGYRKKMPSWADVNDIAGAERRAAEIWNKDT